MSFHEFFDALSQLEQDQSFYENETESGDLKGKSDAALVKLGGEMIKSMKVFADLGADFAAKMQPNFCLSLLEAIQDYQGWAMPPKICGGFCPCMKPSREGPEYETRYVLTRLKVLASIFATKAVVIDDKAEVINMESMHFKDYTNKCSIVMKNLSQIQSNKPGEQAREKAKKDLLVGIEQVNKFMKMFETDTVDMQSEVQRRIAQASELLSSRGSDGGSIPISKRTLVKVQSSLQEIMNSAARVSSVKAAESISQLSFLANELSQIRQWQQSNFQKMVKLTEDRNLTDEYSRINGDTENFYGDANSKVRDATKRWQEVDNQSKPAKVIEYQEDVVQNLATVASAVEDPQRMLVNAGNSIGNIGKKGVGGLDKALTKVAGGVEKLFGIEGENSGVTSSASKRAGSGGRGGGRASGGRGGGRGGGSTNSTGGTGGVLGSLNPFNGLP